MESNLRPDRYLPAPKPDDHGQAQELVRYWRAINRHRLGIVLLVVAVGILAQMYAMTLPPVYRGTATVLLDPIRKKSPVSTEDLSANAETSRDYYATQIEIMKSRDYVERLVRALGLIKHREYDPRQQVPHKGWLASIRERFMPGSREGKRPETDAVASAVDDENIMDSVVSSVMGGLSFSPTRNIPNSRFAPTSSNINHDRARFHLGNGVTMQEHRWLTTRNQCSSNHNVSLLGAFGN